MNKVTSVTIHTTAEGTRASVTYSVLDEAGKVLDENKRVNRIIVDPSVQATADELMQYAQQIVDSE